MRSFEGKVAAVTGAASGMGRALAVGLARRGCDTALSDVDAEGLEATAALVRAEGRRVTTARVDVSDRAAVFGWAEEVVLEHGRVNLLFNNAGIAVAGSARDIAPEALERVMAVNFWGVVHGTQAYLPHLVASGDGHVVNTSSLFGLMTIPTMAGYSASKFAVRGYTEALRMELESAGVPVSATSVHPGGVRTNIAKTAAIDPRLEAVYAKGTEDIRQRFDALLSTTSAEAAAERILAGVARNERRVIVGRDALAADLMLRVVGARYQRLVLWVERRLMR